ncbi:hypothetical protein, partial [Escherichia coli]|uniref:hypothetical protein n=1 Tax=Escherichia coli TaxID=562 RepID=UPI0009499E5E
STSKTPSYTKSVSWHHYPKCNWKKTITHVNCIRPFSSCPRCGCKEIALRRAGIIPILLAAFTSGSFPER